MKQGIFLVALVIGMAFGAIARAQDSVWLQIEAQPNLRQAQERARAYAGAFANVNGFALPTGWYAIVLGPYSAVEAPSALASLKGDRLVPGDSFVADGRGYQRQFWPIGAATGTAQQPVPGLDTPDPAATPETAPTPAALAPAAEPTPLPAVQPEETPAEARRSEAALSREDRMLIQTALQWDGFYNSAIDGAFGPGTRNAMASWQAGRGHEPTGVLTSLQRDELISGYQAAQAALGLQTVRDEEAGIEITLPTALVSFSRYEPPFAHYDARNDSGVRVLLISQPGDQTTLYGLYDIMQTLAIVPLNGDRNRGDRSFMLSGQDNKVHSYTYAELSGGLVKGFTLVWKPTDDERMARVLEAMKTSFRPFGDRALDPTMVPTTEAQREDMMSGLRVRQPVISRTGFYVDAQGTVLTTSEVLKSCTRITIGDDQDAEVAFKDDSLGIVVLKPKIALAPMSFAQFLVSPPRLQSEVAVAGFSYEGVLDAPAITFGALQGLTGLAGETTLRRLSMNVLPGDAGGPVFDGSGAVLGMLLPHTTDSARQLPADVAFATDAGSIAAALGTAGVAVTTTSAGGAMAPEDLTALGDDMTVLISCWD